MIENEGIRVSEAPCCLLCVYEGELLYSGLRDRLFGAPGNWSLMQCPKCQLACLNPQPIPDDVGKLYAQYFSHQKADAPRGGVDKPSHECEASILQSSFGY
jgi:hypothetical protein